MEKETKEKFLRQLDDKERRIAALKENENKFKGKETRTKEGEFNLQERFIAQQRLQADCEGKLSEEKYSREHQIWEKRIEVEMKLAEGN